MLQENIIKFLLNYRLFIILIYPLIIPNETPCLNISFQPLIEPQPTAL